MLAPVEHVISRAIPHEYALCTTPKAWVPTLHPKSQRDPLPQQVNPSWTLLQYSEVPFRRNRAGAVSRQDSTTACCTQNVPRRLSRQCVSVPGDSELINVQASGNSCPAELPDDPSPLCARLWRCGQSRNSVSVQSMPNNMQAGGNTCPAGPLGDADSLPNSPRRCGGSVFLIPSSFPP